MSEAHQSTSNTFAGDSSPPVQHPTPANMSWPGSPALIEAVPGFNPARALNELSPHQVDFSDWDGASHIATTLNDLFGPENVCGNDDRVPVTATRSFPWSAIAHLLMTFTDPAGNPKRYIGTGWFISERALATCGHCVYNHKFGWAQSITVIPGRNGKSAPYGSLTSNALWSVSGWTRDRNPEFDYGAIVLPNNTLGRQTGHFGYDALPDNQLKAVAVNSSGYPGDKPSGTQWFNAGGISVRRPFIFAILLTRNWFRPHAEALLDPSVSFAQFIWCDH